MKIIQRTYPSGLIGWQVDLGVVNGRRTREHYKTESEAEDALEAAQKLRKAQGTMGLRLAGRKGGADVAQFVALQDRVAASGATLSQAVEFFLAGRSAVAPGDETAIEINDAVRAYHAAMDAAGLSKRTMESRRHSLNPFGLRFIGREAHTITGPEIEQWLRSGGWSPRTFKNHLLTVRTFYGWLVREGRASLNPASSIKSPRDVSGEIGTLTVEECKRLLVAARKDKRLLAYVVLGMFCGLRRAELERLRWSAVNLADACVIVAAEHSKTRSRRVVDISKNALRWLRLVKLKSEDLIAPWDFKERFAGVRATAKIREWPNNALRHTFASMHYAQHQNEALLQAQMGHESAKMLHQHYRALKTRADAASFWALIPAKR